MLSSAFARSHSNCTCARFYGVASHARQCPTFDTQLARGVADRIFAIQRGALVERPRRLRARRLAIERRLARPAAEVHEAGGGLGAVLRRGDVDAHPTDRVDRGLRGRRLHREARLGRAPVLDDLGEDADGNLVWAHRADVETGGRLEPREALEGQSCTRMTYLRLSARSAALRSARPVSTRTRSFLYATEPRRSAAGSEAAEASRAACAIVASSSRLPRSEVSACTALIGVSPTLVRAMPACSTAPSERIVSCAATAAVAKSPTLRSSLKYAPPLRAAGAGIRISTRSSPGASAVSNGPVKNEAIGSRRWPLGPLATTSAPSASMVAG